MTTATTALDALLLDIIAHPEDDAPRLIYADALEERGAPGDDARSEFVRVQCRIASFGPRTAVRLYHDQQANSGKKCDVIGCNWCALHRRERELLFIPEAKDWLTGLPETTWHEGSISPCKFYSLEPDMEIVFRRGFVASIACSLANWYGDSCTRCHGTKRIRVVDTRKLEEIRSRGGHPFVPPQKTVACPDCRSTGRIGGHGPALVQSQPLEEVRLTDRRPHRDEDDGLWRWYAGDRDMEDILPPEICRHMKEAVKRLAVTAMGHEAVFRTEADANAALSAGLLSWAKEASRAT